MLVDLHRINSFVDQSVAYPAIVSITFGLVIMTGVNTARKIILSMPEAEELQHHGHPDFRVHNKIFATLWPAEDRVVLKIGWDDNNPLLKSSPGALSKNAWSKQGWTNVHLATSKRELSGT